MKAAAVASLRGYPTHAKEIAPDLISFFRESYSDQVIPLQIMVALGKMGPAAEEVIPDLIKKMPKELNDLLGTTHSFKLWAPSAKNRSS